MNFPISFYLASGLLVIFTAELMRYRREPWAIPAAMVYATVFGWYFLDFLYYRERYQTMPELFVENGFMQVAVFLLAFRIAVRPVSKLLTRNALSHIHLATTLRPEKVLICTIILWTVLLLIGCGRMGWDIKGALFPIDARTGSIMWSREAANDAGPTGFLISAAGYLYLLVCSFFGILAVFERRPFFRILCFLLIAISWPYFLLSGLRNQFLAVSMPSVFAYLLFTRQKLLIKAVVLAVCFLCLDAAFRIVVNYRSVGFRAFFDTAQREQMETDDLEHEGLNMFEELCFINIYCQTDEMQMSLGRDYLANALNFIPRAIWQGKPMIGIDYSVWRGFGGGESDIGVVATISSGLIGQGILEFGPYFGPLAPALLMAIWTGLLARWWSQRASHLRLFLFLVGIGVTFNLGRNITLFTLWPILFGYLIVWGSDRLFGGRRQALTGALVEPSPPFVNRP